MDDPYGRDVLARPRQRGPQVPVVAADAGLVVEDAASGYCGAVVGFEKSYDGLFVRLEDRHGATRIFAMRPTAFPTDGTTVTLERPKAGSAAPA